MGYFDEWRTEFINNVNEYGAPIRIRHFTGSVSNSEWDDAQILTQSGNDVWTSGMIMSVDDSRGSRDRLLIEQGKLLQDDKRLFIAGNIETTDTMKIGLGSPIRQEFSVMENGIIHELSEEQSVYKKIYCRAIGLGSLIGE